ncbi:MAG: hypothetical protein R3E42_10250 [Burkholderiaceae bacterium]
MQPWTIERPSDDTLTMALQSRAFQGNPYHYEAEQTFRLVDGGLDQSVLLRHWGDEPLPYGIGLHPWFPRTPQTRISAPVRGFGSAALTRCQWPTPHSFPITGT